MTTPQRPTLVLPTAGVDVEYHLGDGLLGHAAALVSAQASGGRRFVVTDENVEPLVGARLAEALEAPVFVVPAGEATKGWPTVERVVRWLIGCGVERRDVVIAVGGGVVTDLAGFAASILLRGLPWIAVPTTLLGMVDAAVGGKTGIDLDLGKNLLGTFWPPRAVIADPAALATLEPRQLRAGLAEVVKAGMIAPATLEHVLDEHLEALCAGRLERAIPLIHAAVRVKGEVVAADAREHGARMALNLGHTFGHALEAASAYRRFLHGEAVAWGLLAVLCVARRRDLLSTKRAHRWAERLEFLAPLPGLDGLEWPALEPFVARDKKRVGGEVGWVLPRDGGTVSGLSVSNAEAAEAFDWLRRLSPSGPFTDSL
jgi:3-dehydroquinate synthase